MAAEVKGQKGATPAKLPPQEQEIHPGKEGEMKSEPQYLAPWYRGAEKLAGKVAIITGGDSGIGRSVSILYAREGAKVVVVYHKSHDDAAHTKKMVEKEKDAECMTIAADVSKQDECKRIIREVMQKFGRIDILVNHVGMQVMAEDVREITEDQLDKTFRTNVYSMFFLVRFLSLTQPSPFRVSRYENFYPFQTQEALNHMKEGSCIINTTSVVGFKGHPTLMDYTATKGAIQSWTYSLSSSLLKRGIRVNAVAPGPIWTPFIPSSFPANKVSSFGSDTPMQRPGQPEEVAPAYVFLAAHDSSYISGQTIHVNGGMVVGA